MVAYKKKLDIHMYELSANAKTKSGFFFQSFYDILTLILLCSTARIKQQYSYFVIKITGKNNSNVHSWARLFFEQ